MKIPDQPWQVTKSNLSTAQERSPKGDTHRIFLIYVYPSIILHIPLIIWQWKMLSLTFACSHFLTDSLLLSPAQFLADDTQLLMKSWPEGGTRAKDPPKVPLLQIGCVRLGAARSVLSRDCKCGFRHSFISRFPDYIGGDVFYSPLGNSEIWFVERS